MQGSTDATGIWVVPAWAAWFGECHPARGGGSLAMSYRLLPHNPPVGAAFLRTVSDAGWKPIDSKEVRLSRKLLFHILEGFRRVMDIGSYLVWGGTSRVPLQ